MVSSVEQTVSTGRLKGKDTSPSPYENNINIMKSMDISDDGDSTQMRTVRNSSESIIFRDMASVLPQNVVIENTKNLKDNNKDKLWKMQLGRRKNLGQAESANLHATQGKHTRFLSDAVPSIFSQRSLVNDMLS